jgi:deoxyribodipyrimidine photo-lyase
MTAFRRTNWNFSLQRAAWWSRRCQRPLLIFEGLRTGYPWASERLHRFVIDGMADNQRRCRGLGVAYYPYLEPKPDAGKGLLSALAADAYVVVTDDYPGFFLPRMIRTAGRRLQVALEAVDSNGLLPLGATDRIFQRAYDFRRFLQKTLREHLVHFPDGDPLQPAAQFPPAERSEQIARRWPAADEEALGSASDILSELPIDHSISPSPIRGGSDAAREALDRFLEVHLSRYADLRNHPDEAATSGLSPYLHFGHISAHQVFAALMVREGWSEDLLASRATGSRAGWWGVSESVEGFLDQLVTWRELGFNFAARDPNWDRYETLPDWVRTTLEDHASDPRPYLYDLEEFENAATHDPLWNAAQTQLLREGRLHNYLRMLWGKKILEWSRSGEEALATMLHLNNKYALDGRDPNSVSGITWCLGRYDRPWGPERAVFGKVRYMSSRNTARKVRVTEYLRKYVPEAEPGVARK